VYIWLRWGIPKSLRYYKGGREYEGGEALKFSMEDTVEYFRQRGAKAVYFLLPVPETSLYVPQNAARLILSHSEDYINQTLGMTEQDYLARNKDILNILRAVASSYPFVKLLDPRPFLADAQRAGFLAVENGRSLYSDDNHLSIFGAEKVAPLFLRSP
jgi:hypothetical protein